MYVLSIYIDQNRSISLVLNITHVVEMLIVGRLVRVVHNQEDFHISSFFSEHTKNLIIYSI